MALAQRAFPRRQPGAVLSVALPQNVGRCCTCRCIVVVLHLCREISAPTIHGGGARSFAIYLSVGTHTRAPRHFRRLILFLLPLISNPLFLLPLPHTLSPKALFLSFSISRLVGALLVVFTVATGAFLVKHLQLDVSKPPSVLSLPELSRDVGAD